jgi:predicted SprT family Zn-dependent metalloprotease
MKVRLPSKAEGDWNDSSNKGDDSMASSAVHCAKEDLSDEEWAEVVQRYHESFGKFGVVWRSMGTATTTTMTTTTVDASRRQSKDDGTASKGPSPCLASPVAASDSHDSGDTGACSFAAEDDERPSPSTFSHSSIQHYEVGEDGRQQELSFIDSKASPVTSPSFRGVGPGAHDCFEQRDFLSRRGESNACSSSGQAPDDVVGGRVGGLREQDDGTVHEEGVEISICFSPLRIDDEDSSGLHDTEQFHADDAADHGESLPHNSDGLPNSDQSSVAEASVLSSKASTMSDSSGASTVMCFDHIDFDGRPTRTSTTSPSSFVQEESGPCSTATPRQASTSFRSSPAKSPNVQSTEDGQSPSGSRRKSMALNTPNITLRSNRRRRRQQLRGHCNCSADDEPLMVLEERHCGDYAVPDRPAGNRSTASSSSNVSYNFPTDLICQPCAVPTGHQLDSEGVDTSEVGCSTGQTCERGDDRSLATRKSETDDRLEYDDRTSPQNSDDAVETEGRGRSESQPGHSSHTGQSSWTADEEVEDDSACEDGSRLSIPLLISMSRSVDTIMSPMQDSAWAANTTVAESSICSNDNHEDRPTSTQVDLANQRSIPTSIVRPKAETILSPLGNMTPYIRSRLQQEGRARSSKGASSMTARSSQASLTYTPQRQPGQENRALREIRTTTSADGRLDDDSDDDVPFQQRSQIKDKMRLRRVMLDESDDSAVDHGQLSGDESEPSSVGADSGLRSHRGVKSSPTAAADAVGDLIQTMDGIHIGSFAVRLEGTAASTDESSDKQSHVGSTSGLLSLHKNRSRKQSTGSQSSGSNEADRLSIEQDAFADGGFVLNLVADEEIPGDPIPCQSPRVIDLLDSSSDSDESEEDESSDTDESEEDEAPPRTWKPSSKTFEAVIELLSSSSESECSSELESEFDGEDEKRTGPLLAERSPSLYSSKYSEESYVSTDEESAEVRRPVNRKGHLEVAPQTPAMKRTFLRQRESLAERLFVEYDRIVFKGALTTEGVCTLKWSKRLITTAGVTELHKSGKTATVILSTKLLEREERLRLTLMHELCHAAAWIIDGSSKPPHGKVFRMWGARAERLVPGMTVSVTHDYVIEYKYNWKCQNAECGKVYGRTRRCIDVKRDRCGKCKGQLVEMVMPAKPKAPPSEYQRFVQEHSAAVRQQLEAAATANVLGPSSFSGDQSFVASAATPKTTTKVSQSEVMKECARLWQARKASIAAEPK